jgi:hypothetical protein
LPNNLDLLVKFRNSAKNPQGLKLKSLLTRCGTAEAVP